MSDLRKIFDLRVDGQAAPIEQMEPGPFNIEEIHFFLSVDEDVEFPVLGKYGALDYLINGTVFGIFKMDDTPVEENVPRYEAHMNVQIYHAGFQLDLSDAGIHGERIVSVNVAADEKFSVFVRDDLTALSKHTITIIKGG